MHTVKNRRHPAVWVERKNPLFYFPCIGFSFQVVNIFFCAQPQKQRQAGPFLQLFFFSAEKPKPVQPLFLKKRRKAKRKKRILWRQRAILSVRKNRNKSTDKKTPTSFAHRQVFTVNLRLDFCAKGGFFSVLMKPRK